MASGVLDRTVSAATRTCTDIGMLDTPHLTDSSVTLDPVDVDARDDIAVVVVKVPAR